MSVRIKSISDEAFRPYGHVLEGYDWRELLSVLRDSTECPADSVIYVPGEAKLENLPAADYLSRNVYGGMPVQVGYCNGYNRALNCLEYHRGSEVNVAADDIVLLLAQKARVRDNKLDTAEVEAFHVPSGTAVLLYETALHYAPCTAGGGKGFRVAIVLPKGTNFPKSGLTPASTEDKLLRAKNKWLLAHPDSPEAKDGAWIGLEGENVIVDS